MEDRRRHIARCVGQVGGFMQAVSGQKVLETSVTIFQV